MNERLGVCVALDLYKCTRNYLDDPQKVKELLESAAKKAKATVLNSYVHQFSPHGITCVVAISESHICLHSWPEYDFASIDIYTCGNDAMPQQAIEYIVAKLEPEEKVIIEIPRGDKVL